ncbi:hypothetical protein ACEPJ6_002616 [Salmonella enterica]|nr:hypothetical protein [Salmonella enterica]EBG0480303.1 hypothetical protein [Salmonella enterica subsp. enterica serovar Oranienburg]EBP4105143.1 hypothetical protein [Salmonella enterica subsp. enterica]ECV1242833.1 hypothetical protein [Salmonella enterica subsp. enterica serovar Braenderup]ECY4678846.1 hypothetical protein [Salmonella enterica subsp. enterica serovar Livingstone]EDR8056974.1 hypothetical protein [Salmonella enterica subsp. salamae]
MKKLFVGILLMSASFSSLAFNTGKDLVLASVMYNAWDASGRVLDGKNGSYQAISFFFYVNGAASALHSTNGICIPQGVVMNDIERSVASYIQDNANKIKPMSAALAVTTALKNTYPCVIK